jgi:hypothetical protein
MRREDVVGDDESEYGITEELKSFVRSTPGIL